MIVICLYMFKIKVNKNVDGDQQRGFNYLKFKCKIKLHLLNMEQ